MKLQRIFAFLLIIAFSICTFASCSKSNGADMGGGGDFGGFSEGDVKLDGGMYAPDAGMSYDEDVSGDAGAANGSGGADSSDKNTPYIPGLITAAAHNDNDNFEAWRELFVQGEESNGKFFGYSGDNSWGFSSYNRIKVSVKNGDLAVAGAKVSVTASDGASIFEAVSDAAGNAYLFADGGGNIKVSSSEYIYEESFDSFPESIDVNLEGAEEKKNIIDIMFVVDVTGSMGDELNYLKAELADVIGKVCASDADTVINLALLFYRDRGDSEEFKYFDFTDVTKTGGLSDMQAAINSQYASGGGDYPEAVDEALSLAMEQQWSTGATTKIIFHILDAPPHSTAADRENYKSAVMSAAERGIRICPILCSGADSLTEYLTRQAAVYTGGTFIFVTDDSGIGNSHHDPNLPNVTIEALNSLMVRLIKGYHKGIFEPPVYWKTEKN